MLGERYKRINFLMKPIAMFKSFKMKTSNDGQLLHSELLSRLLIRVTIGTLNLGAGTQVLGPSEHIEAVCEGGGQLAAGGRAGGQVEGDVPEGVYGGGDAAAALADHVGLQAAREDAVYDARARPAALAVLRLRALRVPVQHVQRGDEELVRVLLLVAGQVARVRPDEVQQRLQQQGRLRAAVELLKQSRNLAHEAQRRVVVEVAHMLLREEEVSQQRGVCESLHDAAHEARVPQVDEAPQPDSGVAAHAQALAVHLQQLHLCGVRLPRPVEPI